mgnify:CR=1 FL=1
MTDSEGESQAFTATVQAGGDWSVAVPAELAQGQYTVVAEVRDSVGNLTTQEAQGEIDSVAPTLIVNEVNATIDTTPTISGTSNEIGADVSIIIGGQTLTATVGTDGNWQQLLANWAKSALDSGEKELLTYALPEFERILLEAALNHTNGHKQDAAKVLGWGRNTLTRKLKELY